MLYFFLHTPSHDSERQHRVSRREYYKNDKVRHLRTRRRGYEGWQTYGNADSRIKRYARSFPSRQEADGLEFNLIRHLSWNRRISSEEVGADSD